MKNSYKTIQRELIKEYLTNNADRFINADEIMQYIKKNNQSVGLTTIYRFLNMLEEGQEVRTEVRNHTKYYQYIKTECSNHFHLKCKNCGKITHLNCKELEETNKHIENKHKFKLDYNTIIYGMCGSCIK